MTFIREVTANEKLYLASERGFSHLVIQLVVHGSGHISATALQDALSTVSTNLPGTRLQLTGNRWVATGRIPPVNQLSTRPDTHRLLTHFVGQPHDFDPAKGKTCDVLWAEQGDRHLVAFRALHAVMDGSGLDTFARSVFKCLRGEPIPRADAATTDEGAARALRAPMRESEPKRPRCPGPTANKDVGPSSDFDFARVILRGSIPGVVAKLSVAVRDLLGGEQAQEGLVMVPVDLRPHLRLGSAESTANLTLPLFSELREGQTWNDVSTDLLSQLQAQRFLARGRNDWLYHRMPRGALAWYLEQLWTQQQKRGKYLCSAVISQVTRRPHHGYCAPGFAPDDIVPIPCSIPVAPLSLAVAEFVTTAADLRTSVCLTKGRSLWRSPEEVLQRVLDHAGLSDRVITPSLPAVSTSTAKPEKRDPVATASVTALHQLFERQVDRTPDAPCCTYRDTTRTYRQIDQAANRLAHHLLARGLNRGDIVGVGLVRSLDLPIAIIAAIKAGGVYAPLDPTLPEARLDRMVRDCAARFVITDAHHQARFPGEQAQVHIDTHRDDIQRCPSSRPDLDIRPVDLCTLMYTSGSTGNPKGALNTHRALCNHFEWMRDELDLTAADATLHKTPIGFDASMLEVFVPLHCGARSFIVEPGAHADARHLAGQIRKHGVTFLSVTPSLLSAILDETKHTDTSPLRHFLVGGEAFPRQLYDRLRQHFDAPNIYNLYGPAECAIDTVTYRGNGPIETDTVPIGRPISHVVAHVVDENLRSVEPGQAGELLLGGVAVGAGYAGNRALTEERFVDDPFSPTNGGKLYRTGDLVRQLKSGDLLYVGRRDNQVKIRGVRIELEEIEHHLQRLPFVRQAVVVVHDVHVAGEEPRKMLVAYYACRDREDRDRSGEIREGLRQTLPDAMVPGTYVKVDGFPINENGKVDRQALTLVQPCPAPPRAVEATWTEAQAQLAAVWAEVLKVHVDDACNFFEVGGDSMLAIALIQRVNEQFGSQLHPQCLFENPTFSEFAGLMNAE